MSMKSQYDCLSKRHANIEGRYFMGPQPYTKNYGQLRNTDSGKDSLSQGRAQNWCMGTTEGKKG